MLICLLGFSQPTEAIRAPTDHQVIAILATILQYSPMDWFHFFSGPGSEKVVLGLILIAS